MTSSADVSWAPLFRPWTETHQRSCHAFRIGPASVVARFDYTALIWATLVGWLVWVTLPDPWTYVGAAVIIASGIYFIIRSRWSALEKLSPPKRRFFAFYELLNGEVTKSHFKASQDQGGRALTRLGTTRRGMPHGFGPKGDKACS